MKKKFMFKAVSKAAKEFFDFDYRPNCLIADAAVAIHNVKKAHKTKRGRKAKAKKALLSN